MKTKCLNESCSNVFEIKTSNSNKKFCSQACGNNHRGSKLPNEKLNLPTATVGALNELRVCYDLMKRGFEVFRAQSPACSCDLICLYNNQVLRIEVRTAHFSSMGKYCLNRGKFRADVMAAVLPEMILYELRDSEPSTDLRNLLENERRIHAG